RALEEQKTPPVLEPRPNAILVFRQGFEVFHRALAPMEADALELVHGRIGFSDLCERLAGARPLESAAEEILSMLVAWLSEGLLLRPTDKALALARADG